MTINKDTPIAMLTVGQLQQVLQQSAENKETEQPKQPEKDTTGKKYVYGLAGIRKLFGVSHVTAQKYKDGIIRDAVSQNGRVIITDVEKALKLFAENRK